MTTSFCLTVRFFQPYSHGRGDGGVPEWPPSPLRVFQALVAAAAARWNERTRLEYAAPALRWLGGQPAPTIVAAAGVQSDMQYRLYVPDNVADKVAKSWSKGREDSIAEYRTEKDVRPMHLKGEAVHYLYPLGDGGCPHSEVLSAAARSITHLGWGVDMVAGNGKVLSQGEADQLPGERWQPSAKGGTPLRVPVEGTLAALTDKHAAFLTRLGPDGFQPVPPLTVFKTVGYRRDTEPPARPFAAFRLLTPDADRMRAVALGRTIVVAGMTRHTVAEAATEAGHPQDWVDTYVLGHGPQGPAKGEADVPRFAYLPLPTIDPRGVVGNIRRILVAEPPGGTGDHVAWVRRLMSGQELIDHDTQRPTALLTMLARSDWVVRRYVRESSVWSTVTPVILPGYDDNNPDKTERLLRKAIEQTGLPPGLAEYAQVEWRRVGFRPGVDHSTRYRTPPYLRDYPRYHVRVRWQDAAGRPVSLRGPLSLGGGRFCGLGLFAADE
jgi:CRISPR-associated protein Csb2